MSSEIDARNALDLELAEFVATFYADPLGFVTACFPWGEPGPLEHEAGPDDNQREFLTSLGQEVQQRAFDGSTPVLPIMMAETSGHDTGKSAMGAWLACWILSTRPDSVGTVTAGTFTQLEDRTWPAIRWWMRLCLTAHWFEVQSRTIRHKQRRDWKLVAETCKEENAQSYAGQHARTSTSWYLFDEASQVPDGIWETATGGLLDGEPMWFAWGQPVRNTGWFYRVCFGDLAARWNHRRVDSRTSRFTNKALLAQWEQDYGVDSDYFRVRVLGLPPSASELQYIDKARIEVARHRTAAVVKDEPLIAGFDVSGGGKAWNVIRFRRGLNGDVRAPIRIPGDRDPERSERVGVCAELLADTRPETRVAALFIDAAFGAAIAVRLKALGYSHVYEVNFGGQSPDIHQLNMRAYMHAKAKEWLLLGALPNEDRICEQAALAGYHINPSGKLVIESKADIAARGEASPDDWDAFCLTFSQTVSPLILTRDEEPSYRPVSAWS
jgi:hypothetical protein